MQPLFKVNMTLDLKLPLIASHGKVFWQIQGRMHMAVVIGIETKLCQLILAMKL